MALTEYRRKRDFRKTKEPRGRAARPGKTLLFVVQKHDASHLHYDFRLELNGVLKSWAVPKGPSLDPGAKRLAVEVEDHPIEYGSFEGVIPADEYGGGTVMLWDRGEWEPLGDPAADYRQGKLKFVLHGKKLSGAWMLVRLNRSHSKKPEWLLFKEKDAAALTKGKPDITDSAPLSVATGRDLPEIASAAERVWGANGEQPAAKRARLPERGRKKRGQETRRGHDSQRKPGSKGDKMPKIVEPQLASLVTRAPEGDDWFHEIKFDGYRILCHLDAGQVRLETRNHQDWTTKFPQLAAAARKLPARNAILDGEVVVLDKQGISDFQGLQEALHDQQTAKIVYMVFDLLYFDGHDLRSTPMEQRKEVLAGWRLSTSRGTIRYSEHVIGSGPETFAEAERRGLEGIVSKRRDRPYQAGRGTDWVKTKCQQHAEFVIGGFTDPEGARTGFGALLLGYHQSSGELAYAGRVGTGFNEHTLTDLKARLKPLTRKATPFANFPQRAATPRGTHWVRPELVAQVTFSNWTRDAMLRHPSFQGLREDKPAREVTRELPAAKPSTAKASKPLSAAPRKKMPVSRAARANKVKTVGRQVAAKAPAAEEMIGGVRVTHPDKVLYADVGLTKRDLAHYYFDHADQILPYLADRPLSIVRCPGGVPGESFFQKHPGVGTPPELRRIKIREKSGTHEYLVVDDARALVALVQISALEIHVWGSRADNIERPDRLVFDMDPAPDVPWSRMLSAAGELREFLQELGLTSFVKTTGGKGLHLVIPLLRRHEWAEASEFCQLVARAVERAAPDHYVSKMSKQARTGKIFIDYLRNQRGATAVGALSTRARLGAPVSVPIAWNELAKLSGGDQFRVPDVAKRLAGLRKDPWADIDDVRQSLTARMFKALQA